MSEIFGTLIDLWPLTVVAALAILYFGWRKLKGRLRIFVMMMGGAIAGFFLAVLLHNAIYAVVFVKLLEKPDYDEPVFFIIAVFVCPIVFAVGAVGALVTWLRERHQHQAA
jgi:hypothetical protein